MSTTTTTTTTSTSSKQKAYPLIAIVGPSGSGKSSSLRNLDPKTTKILNIEQKILPFRSALQFGDNDVYVKDSNELFIELRKAINDPEIKTIVIESFTMLCDKIASIARSIASGWEIWNVHNNKVSEFFDIIKNNKQKFIVILAIDEYLKIMSPTGSETTARRVKIDGKKHEGKIEYHFSLVLFTDVKKDKDKPAVYNFVVNTDGMNTAKTPDGMFTTDKIDNDINAVIERVKEYYGIKNSE